VTIRYTPLRGRASRRLDGAGVLGLFVSEQTARKLQGWMARPLVALGGLLLAWTLMRSIFGPALRIAIEVLYLGVR